VDLAIPGLGRARLIGRGGFGAIYSADDGEIGERVAVKILPPELGHGDRARFLRECETMRRVSGHPNVVRFERSGYSGDGRPYVVMELVDGGTLADLVRQEGGLGWEWAVELVLPIVDALGFAHRRGIVHRDIKPENILLAAGDLSPKLADFGIASLEDQTRTVSTGVQASLAHTAPETFDGERDQRSDLYSLASTLYQAVVGRAPFSGPGDELTTLVKRVLTEPVPLIDPGRPGPVDRFFAAALAKDPDQRPASSHELRTWIGTVGAGRDPHPVPPPVVGGPLTEPVITAVADSSAVVATDPMVATNPMVEPFPAVTGPVAIVASASGPANRADLDRSPPGRPGDRPELRRLSPLASAAVGGGGAVAVLSVVIGLWLAVGTGGSDSEPPAPTPAPPTIAPVDIPDLVGRTRAEAEDALVGQALRPEVTVEDLPVGDERDGTVLSQLPSPTTAAAAGATVQLVVGRACTTVTQPVEGQTIEYVPPHRGEGDLDFFGHGPEVTLLVSLSLTEAEVELTIDFEAIETRGDLTEAGGTSEQPLASVPPETPIHGSSLGMGPGVTNAVFDDLRVLDGLEAEVVETPDRPLLARVTDVGDTLGPEAGTTTMVTVETRPFELTLVEPGCTA
jgi:serine/threonine-protein kinase